MSQFFMTQIWEVPNDPEPWQIVIIENDDELKEAYDHFTKLGARKHKETIADKREIQ